MSLLGRSVKKSVIGDFCQKLSMLLDTGYDACSAVELLAAEPTKKSRDHSADGIRRVANLLLPPLKDGFSLHEAMAEVPQYFGSYINQIEVGEDAGKTSEVLARIDEQIKNANKIMSKLRGALTYPCIMFVLTIGVAAYLFTAIIPDMVQMLAEVGVGELPATTRAVMAVSDWMKAHGLFAFIVLSLIVGVFVFYSKTFGKMTVSKLSTRIPVVGKIIENNAMTMFFKSWQHMILAGAEMSVALGSASHAVTNLYLREVLDGARRDYSDNGVNVYDALRDLDCVRDLEVQTIHVAMEGNRLEKTLGVLAEDREVEATKAVNALTAALNPISLCFVGAIVGVIVLAVYQPIISVSSSLG